MRIEIPRDVDRFGAVRFGGLQKVFELDSGLGENPSPEEERATIRQIPYEHLYEIEKDMAIVVPVRNERLKLLEGVLCGIPHPCLIIIVSNSPRTPVDRFTMEKETLETYYRVSSKKGMIVHQKDPLLAKAFQKVNYTSILDKKGRIRNGKAEGMIIATLLAQLLGKRYVGFVDADNYFPGAVEEYVREYAAGFAMSKSRYSMVRIAWHSKPKIVESKFFFRKWGRTSANTNRLLNNLLSHYYGFETEIIKTGNAGEHAMTLDLAMTLDYSAGYSIEPYHIINLVEKFGGINEIPFPEVMQEGIEVFQIESRNPHLHEAGEDEHIRDMSYVAMQVIYHSPVCPDDLKKKILREMVQRRFLPRTEKPPKPNQFPILSSINPASFLEEIKATPYGQLIVERKS
jgi:mannosyl-3-phosphoglycerate synthase